MAINLRELLGEQFRDDMTIGEIEELLQKDTSMVSASELAKEKAKSDKFSREAGEYRKQLNATKSAEELARQEHEDKINSIIAENERLQKELAITETEKKFVSMGYDVDLANKTAVALADNDMEAFFNFQKTFNDNMSKKLQSEILKSTKLPEKQDSQDEHKITKAQLMNMSLAEQSKFAREHPDEYKQLTK